MNQRLDKLGLLDQKMRAEAIDYVRDCIAREKIKQLLIKEQQLIRTEKGRALLSEQL